MWKNIGWLGAFLLVPATAQSIPEPSDNPSEDKVLAPYFQVLGDDSVGALPLKETRANVNIAGVIAHVKVTQVYHNTGDDPIEAIYIFPGSTRAAVFGMTMTIGDRKIVAQINRKDQARKLYNEAKAQGKSASLLEQQRPNVFQMNVANVMPGDEITVELDYSELMIPEEGFYEFVYPAVVGPRYSTKTEGDAAPSEAWVANPHLRKGNESPFAWDVGVNLSAGLGIQKLASPSHQITPKYRGTHEASIALGGTDSFVEHDAKNPGNRDFVLRYRLAGGEIESGLLLFPGEEENFFLMMMQPPERVTQASIPSREYVFILDVSGSMSGFPLDTAKDVMRDLLGDLRPEDSFNVLMFSGGSYLLSERSLSATKANIKTGIDFVDSARGGGGTELLKALDRALNLPTNGNVSRSFVVVTDGYVNVENETFEKIHDNLGTANLFAFGIGSSVNRHIIEGMAHVGMGEPFIVLNRREAKAKADKFRQYIQSPVLTNINVEFTRGFQAYDVEPQNIPDLFAERPVLVFGKYKGNANGRIEVTGVTGDGDFSESVAVGSFKETTANEALKYLWARHKVRNLADMNPTMSGDDVEEVTQLGLKYNLMTAYTSFVAIDNQVRNANGELVTVKQSLPLPAGVEDSSVGHYAPGRVATRKLKVMVPARTPATGGREYDAPDGEPMPEAAGEMLSIDDEWSDSIDGGSTGRTFESVLSKAPGIDDDEEDQTVRFVTLSQLEVETGSAAKRDIRSALQRVLKKIKACGSTGSVQVRVTFSADGSVTSVEIMSAPSRISTICVTEALKKAQLKAGVGSTTTVVTLSLR